MTTNKRYSEDEFRAVADKVLDVVLDNGGTYVKVPGEVLKCLTGDVYRAGTGEVFDCKSVEYGAVSDAVRWLEELELLTVERKYGRRAARANLVVAIRVRREEDT